MNEFKVELTVTCEFKTVGKNKECLEILPIVMR